MTDKTDFNSWDGRDSNAATFGKFDVSGWLRRIEDDDQRDPHDHYRLVEGEDGLALYA